MREDIILNAIGNIDDKMIEEALKSNIKKISFSRVKKITVILIAAVIAVSGCTYAIAKQAVNMSYHITDRVVQEGAKGIVIADNLDIEYNAVLDNDDIKNNFGVKFISSDLINNEYLYQPIIEDNFVMRVDLWNAEAYKNGDKELCVWACFWTQNATEEYNPGNQDLDAAGDKVILEKYHINLLDCDAVIYTFENAEIRISADILYENISYNYMFFNYNIDEVKEILDTLYV